MEKKPKLSRDKMIQTVKVSKLNMIYSMKPFSFYFVYSSFKTIQSDTKIVHQTAWVGGALESIGLSTNDKDRQNKITQIDATLKDISQWVEQNSDSKLYIGLKSLSDDFTQVNTCWNEYKRVISAQQDVAPNDTLQCWENTSYLSIVVEKMVYLKQKKMINLFYASLTIAMLLILLVIYLVRIYIHKQMKKHSIHDHDSRLFNKKYFMAELKTTCSRSARHNYPLSILRVSIDDFDSYSNRQKRNTLKVFGILMHALVRDGDIPCRYDNNHFLILLPFTEEHNALILEERIEEVLKNDKWMTSHQITFDFNTTEFDKKLPL